MSQTIMRGTLSKRENAAHPKGSGNSQHSNNRLPSSYNVRDQSNNNVSRRKKSSGPHSILNVENIGGGHHDDSGEENNAWGSYHSV